MRSAAIATARALADFLPPHRRMGCFEATFELPVGLRDLIQSVGIPHVEVASATLNGAPADWYDRVDDGAVIELEARYPLEEPPEPARFVLDVHLGKLARHLRLVGIDTAYSRKAADPDLVRMADNEHRILLTRDLRLLMRAALWAGSYVRSTDPIAQGREIIDRFALGGIARPFSRCLECNGQLIDADPTTVAAPPDVLERHDTFRRCTDCARVYWRGSHTEHLEQMVVTLLGG